MNNSASNDSETSTDQNEQGLTILMASDDLDRVFLGFMMATAARSMGMPVNIFFALWGVNLLRRKKDQTGMKSPTSKEDEKKKSMMAKMMGMMMPKGPEEVGLSKMNFGGMGAVMMRSFMKESGASSLPELMDMAIEVGVKFTLCSLTMEIMGFKYEEMLELPNMQCGGITSCLGDAMQSKMFVVM